LDISLSQNHLFPKEKKIYSNILTYDTLHTSHYIPRTEESFKPKDNTSESSFDLTEMMKLSIQLTQSLRMMRSIASRPLLEKGLSPLDIGIFSKLLLTDTWKQNTKSIELSDYDILFWNILSRQCIRKIRQPLGLDNYPFLPTSPSNFKSSISSKSSLIHPENQDREKN